MPLPQWKVTPAESVLMRLARDRYLQQLAQPGGRSWTAIAKARRRNLGTVAAYLGIGSARPPEARGLVALEQILMELGADFSRLFPNEERDAAGQAQ